MRKFYINSISVRAVASPSSTEGNPLDSGDFVYSDAFRILRRHARTVLSWGRRDRKRSEQEVRDKVYRSLGVISL